MDELVEDDLAIEVLAAQVANELDGDHGIIAAREGVIGNEIGIGEYDDAPAADVTLADQDAVGRAQQGPEEFGADELRLVNGRRISCLIYSRTAIIFSSSNLLPTSCSEIGSP